MAANPLIDLTATLEEAEVTTADGTRRRAEISSVLIPGGDVSIGLG